MRGIQPSLPSAPAKPDDAEAGRAAVLVRDSVNPTGAVVVYAPTAWQAFISSAKAGSFDFCR